MFHQVPEVQMHKIRWFLAIAWLLLILTLFFDPFTSLLTNANYPGNPFRLNLNKCILIQGYCIAVKPYSTGIVIFWGLVIPTAIFVLLVGGHELWRRICPLSFLSQLPKALGWQRTIKKSDEKTGKVRQEIAKVKKGSWLANNYFYVQFAGLYLGLCGRLLFFNTDRLLLGIFLCLTIASAILIGYLYDGKSWCQYFCPMAPVQQIYGEPRGLFNSKAHERKPQKITQSMCRITDQNGIEKSGCVGCQSNCIDIDAEKSYWHNITAPDRQFLYYGYVGLTIGYFVYHYLYAGNWDFFFTGAWAMPMNNDTIASLFRPGFFWFNRPILIPKIVAVPLTLGLFTYLGYCIGKQLEKIFRARQFKHHPEYSREQVQQQMFSLCTFFIFNFFFIFAGQTFCKMIPEPVEVISESIIIILSTVWLYRTWSRSPALYSRESVATLLRQQLNNLALDVSQFLEGRTLESLTADEVYVLAKVLPNSTHIKRLKVYQKVMRDSIANGHIILSLADHWEKLHPLRLELDISETEHLDILNAIITAEPELVGR